MSSETERLAEIEEDRQRQIEEMVAERGEQWVQEYSPGSFGCHELLDRTSLAVNQIEANILGHPACIKNREWYELAEQAAAALRELYQRVGVEHL